MLSVVFSTRATEIMRQMGVAEDTDMELYIRHLTLLVILYIIVAIM